MLLVEARLNTHQQCAHVHAGVCWQKCSHRVVESDSSPVAGIWDRIWNSVSRFVLCGVRKALIKHIESSRGPPSWSPAGLRLLEWCARRSWGSWTCSALRKNVCLQPPDVQSGEGRAELFLEVHRWALGSRTAGALVQGTEVTEIFPCYLSIHFPFPHVLAMPASTKNGKAGTAFIIRPLEDGRTNPFLFLLSVVLLML